MFSPRLYKYWDLHVLYTPTVHTFGTVNFTHTLLVQTHTWRFHPLGKLDKKKHKGNQISKGCCLVYAQKLKMEYPR